MRRLLLLLLSLLALSSFVLADEWHKSFPLTGKPELRVETSDAHISVTAWDKNSIEARVTTEGYKIGDDGIRVVEHQNGNLVELEVRYPHHDVQWGIGWHNRRVSIDIQMPREAKVNLRTGDGRITLNGIKGELDLFSGDGAQEITSVDGSLRAHTSDGRITVSGRFDALDLNTGDGRIDATAHANSTMAREWSLHTGDGGVTLRLPPTLAADVQLHTGDGHISVDVPVEVSGRLGGHDIRGKMNGGGKMLTIHTGDGSISLEKS